jgi:hypothetical protein
VIQKELGLDAALGAEPKAIAHLYSLSLLSDFPAEDWYF